MIAPSVGCSLGCLHSQLGKPVNPVVTRCFSLKRGRLSARFVAFLGEPGPGRPEQLIKMATGQLPDAYGMRLQPPRQGRHL
jgi:hypothetical protein